MQRASDPIEHHPTDPAINADYGVANMDEHSRKFYSTREVPFGAQEHPRQGGLSLACYVRRHRSTPPVTGWRPGRLLGRFTRGPLWVASDVARMDSIAPSRNCASPAR